MAVVHHSPQKLVTTPFSDWDPMSDPCHVVMGTYPEPGICSSRRTAKVHDRSPFPILKLPTETIFQIMEHAAHLGPSHRCARHHHRAATNCFKGTWVVFPLLRLGQTCRLPANLFSEVFLKKTAFDMVLLLRSQSLTKTGLHPFTKPGSKRLLR